MSEIREIPLADIQTGGTTQMRVAGIDPAVVADYATAMEEGATFPPIILFHDGETYWPGDGFHRLDAAKRINRDSIAAEVREGKQRDALLHAASANASHGLRRTQADKKRSVETLLRDAEWAKWSDRQIGKACAVDHKTVGRIRREVTGEFPTERVVTYNDRHGNQSEMRVSVSGSSRSVFEKVLSNISDEALIAECHRRGLEVANV